MTTSSPTGQAETQREALPERLRDKANSYARLHATVAILMREAASEVERLAALATAAPASKTETVPWPTVDSYAGGADAGGLHAWLDVRFTDEPETVRYVPASKPPAAVSAAQAMADRAEITLEQLAALPRTLLDIGGRINCGEASASDGDIVDKAAHAIKGALRAVPGAPATHESHFFNSPTDGAPINTRKIYAEAGAATHEARAGGEQARAECTASSACPVCGQDTPHGHSQQQIAVWLEAQAGRFLPGLKAHVFFGPHASPPDPPQGWKFEVTYTPSDGYKPSFTDLFITHPDGRKVRLTVRGFNDPEVPVLRALQRELENRASQASNRDSKIPESTPAGAEVQGQAEAREPENEWLTAAAMDVLEERQRQIDVEGYTSGHDDEHAPDVLAPWRPGAMALAAACYCQAAESPQAGVPSDWPWAPEWWKPKHRRQNLVRAGALVLAEIERLDRVDQPEREGDHEGA